MHFAYRYFYVFPTTGALGFNDGVCRCRKLPVPTPSLAASTPPSRLLLLVPPPSTPLQLTSGTGTPATHALQLNVLRLNTNSATTGNAQVHETREHRLVRSRARAVVLLTRWGWFAQGTRAWVGVALHQALSTSSLIFTVMRTRILDKCATALL